MKKKFNKKQIYLFITGQSISNFGNSLTYLAIMFYIYKLTNNTLSVGLFLAIRSIPSIVLGPFVGVLVDKWDKKKTLIITEIIRFNVSILFIFFTSLKSIYVLICIQAIITLFYNTAKFSTIPNLSTKDELLKVNSMFSLVEDIISISAPVIGGIIAKFLGYKILFIIDSVTFLISIVSICIIKINKYGENEKNNTQTSLIKEIIDGGKFIIEQKQIRNLIIVFCLIMLSGGALNTIMLPYTTKILKGNEIIYGTLCSIMSISYIIGSTLITFLNKKVSSMNIFFIGCCTMAGSILLIGLTHNLMLAYILWGLNSIGNIFTGVTFDTLLQMNVKQDMLGRVYSLSNMFIQIANLFSITILGGYLGMMIEIPQIFIICAIILAISVIISFVGCVKVGDICKQENFES